MLTTAPSPTRGGGIALAVLLLLSGCRGPGKVGEPVDTRVDRKVRVRVAGARTADLDAIIKMQFLVREGEREQVELAVVAIAFDEPVDPTGKRKVAFEVGIAGMYKGDGTYTIPRGIGVVKPTSGPTVPPEVGEGTVALSNVSALFYGGTPSEPTEERFGYLAERCTLKLENGATEGSVKCPALANAEGERVSLDASWRA